MAAAKSLKNPYMIDSTIVESELFFGREALFNFIKDNLNQGQKVILLFGNRKIGKSSVLKQIPKFFRQDRFVFVNFDLQDKAKESLSQILYLLACEICAHLVYYHKLIADDRVTPPLNMDLEKDSEIFYGHFLPQVFQELGDKKLVLLLDEFDVFSQDNAKSTEQHFFSYLKKLIEKHEKLFIIPVVGQNLSDLPDLLSLFNNPPREKIGLLDKVSAKELITIPAQGILEYDPDAIQAILELSAGHPYFTLIICFALFRKVLKLEKSKVSCEDVESVVDQAIELAEGGLSCFWDELSIPQQVVFSAVAEAQAIAILANQQLPEDPLTLLKSYGVIEIESLIQAANQLANTDLLDDTQRRVKIELVRRWLVQRHPLRQEIRQLEKLEQAEVNPLREVATRLHQKGKKQNVLTLYELILDLNPNHFSTIVDLAERYLEVEDIDKAVELYTRAYQVDPLPYKEGLLLALQTSGQKLITQRAFAQANEQFNRILEIEPDNKLAQEKLRKDYNWVEARGRIRNPYTIGTPIEDRELFFGRESLFIFIEDNLQQNVKVILLHGQRRIGKSSVLKQIPQFLAELSQNDFVFVNFDLQDKSNLSLSQVLHLLATEIFTHLCDYLEPTAYDRVFIPSNAELKTEDIDIFSRQFLPQVYQGLGDKNLVLLLDEFDVLSDNHIQSAQEHFFPYLKGLIERHERLFIIPVVGRNLDDLPKLLSLFGRPPYQEIGLLDELSAKRLITKPVHGVLEYDQDAIKAILELSAGHPYFTQIICNALFRQARAENKSQITRLDVNSIVDKAIENAEGGLNWFWQGLPISEQVVFSAVAEAQRIAISENQPVPEEPLKLLKSCGVIQTDSLILANHQLADKGFLDNTERRMKIELVRRWLIQSHPLRQEIWQLEKLEQEKVNRLWEVANRLDQQGKKQNALTLYEQILEINPNHFSTIAALAERYLEIDNCDKAVELYTRAYQVDPLPYKEGLLLALQTSGQKLITQRAFAQAKEQFNRILDIEPNNRSAQEQLLKINKEPGESLVGIGQNSIRSFKRRGIPLSWIAAVAGIIALFSVGVQWKIPCSVRSTEGVRYWLCSRYK